ncbi:MAG: DM13 domain-containing protein [Salinirussus sp.]
MADRRQILLAAGGPGLVALAVSVAVIGPSDFLLPERSTTVEESPTGGDVLKTGSFVGTDHDVSGQVSLVLTEGGLALRFENYSQQQGPDVFVYVTPAETPDSGSEINDGRKVRIDGGADNGESTKEGTFTQPLPEGVSAEDINGVGVWCDRFGVPFGYATLSPAG